MNDTPLSPIFTREVIDTIDPYLQDVPARVADMAEHR